MKKTNTKGRIIRLIRQLFTQRTKDYVPVYLSRFETIEKLIAEDLLAIDLENRYVCIDASLHIQYMNNDRKYVAFFDNLRAYMNFHFGQMQKQMITPEDRINFGVMLKQTRMYDTDTGEFYDQAQVEYHTLIVGINQHNKVEYDVYKAASSNHNISE